MPATTIVRPGLKSEPRERPYAPSGAARALFRNRDREVLLAGPAGTGKSRACLEKLNMIAMQLPIRAAIVRKVRKSLTQSAMVTFEHKVLPVPSGVKFHEGDQEYRYPSGARIMVAGLDDPEKIGSTEFDVVYVQEATELTEDDWGMLLRGLRHGVLSYQQLIADCNPTYPDHWLKLRCDSGRCTLLESQHKDNPQLWDPRMKDWTQQGRDYMAALDSLQGYLYKRLRLGLWVAAQGMYFTDWDPALHIVPEFEIPESWPRWIAVDYGFAAPFCCLWFAREPETRSVFVYRELYAPGYRDEQQAEAIKQQTGEESLALRILDPSMFNIRREQNRPSIAQVYWESGVFPVYPGMNDRKQGWAIMRRAIAHDGTTGQPRFRVMAGRAPNLQREIPALVMDPLDPEDVADVVAGVKVSDHAADACRYGLCAEAQPPRPYDVQELQFG